MAHGELYACFAVATLSNWRTNNTYMHLLCICMLVTLHPMIREHLPRQPPLLPLSRARPPPPPPPAGLGTYNGRRRQLRLMQYVVGRTCVDTVWV